MRRIMETVDRYVLSGDSHQHQKRKKMFYGINYFVLGARLVGKYLIIDNGSSDNIIGRQVINQLQLPVE